MAEAFFSLAVITAVAFLSPFLSTVIPGRWLQSSALMLIGGAIVGPHMLGLVNPQADGMDLLESLGLAFVFLMSGYELSPKAVVGKTGRHAIASWSLSFLLALGVSALVGHSLGNWSQVSVVAFAVAIASTSYVDVEDDMEDRKLMHTRFGRVVASYGATGELLPVVAIAVLVSEGAPAVELAIMAGFALLALGVTRFAKHEQAHKTEIDQFVEKGPEASQTMLQLVIAITVALVALGVVLGADMIVAGFAAGYILKQLIPDSGRHKSALTMLRAVAYGFFIPLVFVLAGCDIDLEGGMRQPLVVLLFVVLLFVVRGVPVFAAVTLFPTGKPLSIRQRIGVAFYSCTTLSTVVAMTDVAVEAGDLSATVASTLVFAAALVTIVIPIAERLIEPAKDIREH